MEDLTIELIYEIIHRGRHNTDNNSTHFYSVYYVHTLLNAFTYII